LGDDLVIGLVATYAATHFGDQPICPVLQVPPSCIGGVARFVESVINLIMHERSAAIADDGIKEIHAHSAQAGAGEEIAYAVHGYAPSNKRKIVGCPD
jgi:hypothetical protein